MEPDIAQSLQNVPASDLPINVTKAYEFETAQRATGQTEDDPFYSVPSNSQNAAPGTLLKLENVTNTTLYTVSPGLSMSRFIYQSQKPNGTRVPVSAYILWPYTARSYRSGGYPVIALAHGTSGITSKCAPSSIKNLWQHFLMPFQLAIAGYVVVATDYKGLGVGVDALGHEIIHEWINGPDQAEDIIWSIPAAQAAFPELSKEFVIVGHSQGGAAAWGAAEKFASQPIPGYLGTIAGSPATRWLDLSPEEPFMPYGTLYLTPAIAAHAPPGTFKPEDILTTTGVKALETLKQLKGCNAVVFQLGLQPEPLLQPNYHDNKHFRAYLDLVAVSRKELRGPLLVTQGDADPIVNHTVTTDAVNETARLFPQVPIEYHTLRHITHNPSMPTALQIWLDWIAARFEGVPAERGLKSFSTKPVRPASAMQPEVNWVIEEQKYTWQSE